MDSTIDPKKVNPNLNRLHNHFYQCLSQYFNADDTMRPEFFEETVCYNCGQSSINSEFIVDRFRHVRCANCGMVYVSPRLREDILHNAYNEEDYTAFFRLKLIPALEYRRNVLAKRKFDQIQAWTKRQGRVLDIGSGLGEVLSVFKEHGWECLGIEFNSFAAEFSRKEFDLEIVNTSIFDFDSSDQPFDCIMLWGVLEHFKRPKKVLNKVRELLHQDGLLVVEVPSADSLLVCFFEQTGGSVNRIIEGDRHLMLFSHTAFRQMMRACGFKILHYQTKGLDVHTIFQHQGVCLDSDLEQELQFAVDCLMAGDLIRAFLRKA